VSELDETVLRNFDYIVSVNCLTAYLLLKLNKPVESLEFSNIGERAIQMLIK
jgi:hypothetical protein